MQLLLIFKCILLARLCVGLLDLRALHAASKCVLSRLSSSPAADCVANWSQVRAWDVRVQRLRHDLVCSAAHAAEIEACVTSGAPPRSPTLPLLHAKAPTSNASVLTTYFEVDLSHTCVPHLRDHGTLCLHALVSIDAGVEGGLSRCKSSTYFVAGQQAQQSWRRFHCEAAHARTRQ